MWRLLHKWEVRRDYARSNNFWKPTGAAGLAERQGRSTRGEVTLALIRNMTNLDFKGDLGRSAPPSLAASLLARLAASIGNCALGPVETQMWCTSTQRIVSRCGYFARLCVTLRHSVEPLGSPARGALRSRRREPGRHLLDDEDVVKIPTKQRIFSCSLHSMAAAV